jgi:hypothetical protein
LSAISIANSHHPVRIIRYPTSVIVYGVAQERVLRLSARAGEGAVGMRNRNLLSLVVFLSGWLAPTMLSARVDIPPEEIQKNKNGPQRVFVLDGSTVHNVGELQMNVGNWGMFGSWPGAGRPFSEAPSAQWPAGSGVEYLFTAGLWVGALKSGVPAVSQAAYEWEFRPAPDTRDIMYRASEGSRGGNRKPSTSADDDRDGKVDEDWLNGYDDDGDGKIDEDYAAISKQMFSCQYTDNQPSATQIYPQHNPLNLHVRQESYQWEEDRFDDFVGVQFWITNIGNDVLTDLFIGFFADGDAGPRDRENYWEDDGTGFESVPVKCTDLGPVSMDIAYVYDVDGDEGRTPGYLGVLFLGHTTDPNGEFAPRRVGVSTYANFSGSQSFEDGGDPTNDFERYELLSSKTKDRTATIPRDYRMLMAAGPFAELLPGSTLVFQTAFAIGDGNDGLLENASAAQLTFEGAWFDLVGNDPSKSGFSGFAGRETRVDGPADGIYIDSCDVNLFGKPPVTVPRGTTIYINNDCGQERAFKEGCNYSLEDSSKYMTGINGQETQIFWIVGTAPPPPSMRLDPANREGVAVYWDNFSETQPDVKTQIFDFEGYRVFRADNWARPEGSSVLNGPGSDLWKLIFQADIRNGFGEDTGLDAYRYEPLTHIMSASAKADMVRSIKQYLTEYPGQNPPCPQGVTRAVCDTLTALAAYELGLENGRQYYRYIDRSIHRGRPYFYAVTASDHNVDGTTGAFSEGKVGDPSSNFAYIEPETPSQLDYQYKEDNVYVVPNPATKESLQPWTLSPNNEDPTGIKVEFRNLPADKGTIRIYTLAGDLVKEIEFDGRNGIGTMKWDLVSRNGQDVASGIYIYSVETDTNDAFKRKIGKFVVIR